VVEGESLSWPMGSLSNRRTITRHRRASETEILFYHRAMNRSVV